MHFDPPFIGIIKCKMGEIAGIKIGIESVVDMCEYVEIKLGGYPLRIIIGSLEFRNIFFQIHAYQQSPTLANQPVDSLQ